jgi:phosphoglycerate dehydrogenase-like enzyme
MPRYAYFINTARAAIVDYDALVGILKGGAIAGDALDIYPVEPLPGRFTIGQPRQRRAVTTSGRGEH